MERTKFETNSRQIPRPWNTKTKKAALRAFGAAKRRVYKKTCCLRIRRFEVRIPRARHSLQGTYADCGDIKKKTVCHGLAIFKAKGQAISPSRTCRVLRKSPGSGPVFPLARAWGSFGKPPRLTAAGARARAKTLAKVTDTLPQIMAWQRRQMP